MNSEHSVDIDELIKTVNNLRCCGNCECPLNCPAPTYKTRQADRLCESWQPDNLTINERIR